MPKLKPRIFQTALRRNLLSLWNYGIDRFFLGSSRGFYWGFFRFFLVQTPRCACSQPRRYCFGDAAICANTATTAPDNRLRNFKNASNPDILNRICRNNRIYNNDKRRLLNEFQGKIAPPPSFLHSTLSLYIL